MKPTTILEVLEAVDQKLSSSDKWTQGKYAKDNLGYGVTENSPMAVCHCLVGAIISVTEMPNMQGIADKIGDDTIIFLGNMIGDAAYRWNDEPDRTFEEVKNLLKRAKEKAAEVQL